ncbi:phage tail protein [Klebsiella pneumoniae]
MSQTVITSAFEQLKAQEAANGGVVILDEFVFANVPNLDITSPIDRGEGLPDEALIVHRQAVGKTGMVNNNAVVYSVVMGADVGDFDFNWVGLVNSANNVVAMIVHAPTQKKIKTATGQQGNVLTRSFLMEYNGASEQTQIITPADTWQIDFTARLNGVDERIRCENMDIYGAAAFMDDSFLVVKNTDNYLVKKGTAYIAGVRGELLFDQNLNVGQLPTKIWVDVSWKGTLTSVWASSVKLTVAEVLENYTENDEQHYVFAIAEINIDGGVSDLRLPGVKSGIVNELNKKQPLDDTLTSLSGLDARKDMLPYFTGEKSTGLTELTPAGRKMLGKESVEDMVSFLELDRVVRASIHQYMSDEDLVKIKSQTGAEIDTDYALKKAINDGVTELFYPPVAGVYVHGNTPVTLPSGFNMYGVCKRPYVVGNDATFNGCGTVIRKASGKAFLFYMTGRHTFRQVNFDGREQSGSLTYGVSSSSQMNGSRFIECGIYRFGVGLGWSNYIATLYVQACNISGNGTGMRNLIDSRVIDSVINANITRGVSLLTGANNNSFIGVRNEWNGQENYYAYKSVENIISGELCDRAGYAAIAALEGGSWVVDGTVVRRSGANVTEGDNSSCHFMVVGDKSSITMSGVVTGSGADDDGGGLRSPSFVFSSTGKGNSNVIASGCNFFGFIKSLHNEKNTLLKVIRSCLGCPDEVNTGLSKSVNGRGCIDSQSGILSSGVGSVFSTTLGNIPPGLYGDHIFRTLLIEGRVNSTGASVLFRVPLVFKYESTYVDMVIIASEAKNYGSKIDIDGGAKGASVQIKSDTEGKQLTVSVTSIDGLDRNLTATLLWD